MLLDLLKDKEKFFNKIKFTPFLMQYPSPDLWEKDFSKTDFLDNLLDLSIDNLNLYIHIPFCDYLCAYCSFSKILVNNEYIDKYFLKLEKEIQFYNNFYDFSSLNIKTIFIGGGTPTILNEKQIERLGNIFIKFGIKTNGEFTIETNPDRIGTTFKVWKNIGVNRISIGQQTFDKDILKNQNRNFIDFGDFKNRISYLRKIGFDNINIDMIYGFGQTDEILKKDIEKLKQILPEHISFYPLILYYKKLNNKQLADYFDKLEENYNFIVLNLGEYSFYTMEYATRKDSLDKKHIYQINYLKGENTLGLGSSGFSFLENVWFKNYFHLNSYLNTHFFQEYVYYVNNIVSLQRKFILGLRLNIIEKQIVDNLIDVDIVREIFTLSGNSYILKADYRKYQDLLLYYFNQKFNGNLSSS